MKFHSKPNYYRILKSAKKWQKYAKKTVCLKVFINVAHHLWLAIKLC